MEDVVTTKGGQSNGEETEQMLPAYIIEEILKWERDKKQSSQSTYLEYPLHDDYFESYPDDDEREDPESDGLAIIDFTI